MGAAATGLQAAGAGTSAYASYTQGLAQQRYYKYQADAARQTADMTLAEGDRESRLIQDEGLTDTEALNQKTAKLEGAQRVAQAANGTSGSVTAADIAVDTERQAHLDRMLIRYNADKSSWAARQNAALKAWQLKKQAAENEVAGVAAKRAGKLGAFNSLLGGAGQVASTWSNLAKSAPSAAAAA